MCRFSPRLPENDRRNHTVTEVVISADRLTERIQLDGFGNGDTWVGGIYHISMRD